MVHTIDVLSSTCTQLNVLTKEYLGISKIVRTMPKIMDSLSVATYRSVNGMTDAVIDPDVDVTIDKGIIVNTKSKYHPIYMLSVKNINKPFVDKIITLAKTSENDIVNGVVIGVPYIVFDDNTDFNNVCKIIKDLYFSIADNMDKYMTCKANFGVLNFSNSKEVYVPTYDLSIVLATIGFMYVNLKAWFTDVNETDNEVFIKEFLDALDYEFPKDVYDHLVNTILKHGDNINDIKDAVIAGTLVRDFIH